VEVVRKGIGKFWTCRNSPEITQCFKLKLLKHKQMVSFFLSFFLEESTCFFKNANFN